MTRASGKGRSGRSLGRAGDDTPRELHVERLVSRQVVDAEGKPVGRIEELLAEQQGSDYVVTEVHVGRAGLAERFSVRAVGTMFTRLFGARSFSEKPWRIPWHDLDLHDPEHPRLKKRREELENEFAGQRER
jgi:sporulation protein YlmC with PRC-barrel domain